MNKSKLALAALSAMSTVAYGQSNVTLYGVTDTAIEYVTNVASRTPTINATTGAITQQPGGGRASLISSGGLSGSRWGLRGSEDLGNGLQAVFTLESGFGLDTGVSAQGGRLFGRQAFVGLQKEGYGRLSFGRQYSTMFDALANFDPLYYAPLYEPSSVQLGPALRQDNMVKYAITMGPVTAEAHYSFGVGVGTLGVIPLTSGGAGETPGNFRDNSAYGAALTYASGPFGVTAVYDQWNPADSIGNAGKVKKAAGAANYTVGPVKFTAGYRWGDAKSGTGISFQRDDFYWAGVNYQATAALALTLAYYYDNIKSLRPVFTAPATNPANPWQVSFLADYSFSKRTDVYLSAAFVKNSGINFDSAGTGFAIGYPLEQNKTNQFAVAAGIRHKF